MKTTDVGLGTTADASDLYCDPATSTVLSLSNLYITGSSNCNCNIMLSEWPALVSCQGATRCDLTVLANDDAFWVQANALNCQCVHSNTSNLRWFSVDFACVGVSPPPAPPKPPGVPSWPPSAAPIVFTSDSITDVALTCANGCIPYVVQVLNVTFGGGTVCASAINAYSSYCGGPSTGCIIGRADAPTPFYRAAQCGRLPQGTDCSTLPWGCCDPQAGLGVNCTAATTFTVTYTCGCVRIPSPPHAPPAPWPAAPPSDFRADSAVPNSVAHCGVGTAIAIDAVRLGGSFSCPVVGPAYAAQLINTTGYLDMLMSK